MRLMQNHKSATGRRSERRGSVRKSVGIAPVCLFNKILFHKEAGRLLSGLGGGEGLCSAKPVIQPVRLSVPPSDGPCRSQPQPALAPARFALAPSFDGCIQHLELCALALLRPPPPSRATIQWQRGARPCCPPPAAMLCHRQR